MYGSLLIPLFIVAEVLTLTAVTGFTYAEFITLGGVPELTSRYRVALAILTLIVFSVLFDANKRFDEASQ